MPETPENPHDAPSSMPDPHPDRPRGDDWALQAQHDLAAVVPLAFFPWWANAAFVVMCLGGLHYFGDTASPVAVEILLAVGLYGWGARLRRGPRPSFSHFWLATIVGLAAFLVVLGVYINEDSIAHLAWLSTSAGVLGYMAVMTFGELRRLRR